MPIGVYPLKSTIERFWDKVAKLSNGCWEWQAGLSSTGYGAFNDGSKIVSAHRFAYVFLKGRLPAGLEIDHLCRNHKCVNPNHLEAVTHRENILRGAGITVQEARRTHCPHGHPYDKKNTCYSKGVRYCLTCAREKYWKRKDFSIRLKMA